MPLRFGVSTILAVFGVEIKLTFNYQVSFMRPLHVLEFINCCQRLMKTVPSTKPLAICG